MPRSEHHNKLRVCYIKKTKKTNQKKHQKKPQKQKQTQTNKQKPSKKKVVLFFSANIFLVYQW